jgi:hypothetical protein
LFVSKFEDGRTETPGTSKTTFSSLRNFELRLSGSGAKEGNCSCFSGVCRAGEDEGGGEGCLGREKFAFPASQSFWRQVLEVFLITLIIDRLGAYGFHVCFITSGG